LIIGVHSFLWLRIKVIIPCSFNEYSNARLIYKQIDKKEETKKNKILREWIMEDNISRYGSRWDNLRYREWSSHLFNRMKM
jgi:hypothetical protein